MADERSRDERPRERRTRGLLSSYYGVGGSSADPLDVDGPNFNADKYVNQLLENQSLSDLVRKGNDMVTEIKSLDSDMQMLVYENYNKFISATDTIRAMKQKVEGMEEQMNQLATNMETIIESNRAIASNVTGRRGQLEQLNGVRKLLVKLQFLFDLPTKLQECIEAGEHEKAVHFYHAATNILKHYGHLASFQPIHDEAVDIMGRLKHKLSDLIGAESTPAPKLAESVRLLLQLQGNEDDLLHRFVSRSRALVLKRLAALPASAQPGAGASADEFEAYYAQVAAEYVPATLEYVRAFAMLFLGGGGAAAAAAGGSDAPHHSAGTEHKRGALEQSVHETFDTFAQMTTDAVKAAQVGPSPDIEPLTCAIRALTDAARTIAEGGAEASAPLDALVPRACALGAGLARAGISSEMALLGERSLAAASDLCADASAASSGGEALVLADAVHEAVGKAAGAVMGLIDSTMQSTRPLLLALPGQGLVREAVNQLLASLRDFVLSLRRADLAPARGAPSERAGAASGAADGRAEAWRAASAAFLSCALCTELATRVRTDMQRIVSGHLMFAQAEFAAPLPVSSVVLQLEDASEALNIQCVDLLAGDLAEEMRSFFVQTDWLGLPRPRSVSACVDTVVRHVARVLGTFERLYPEAAQPSGATPGGAPVPPSVPTTAKQLWSPTGALPAQKVYASRLRQGQMSASVIQSDIDRMFSQKVPILAHAVGSTRAAAGRVLTLALKALYELVRLCTLSQHGYQQLQVDMTMLRWTMQDCVEDGISLQALVDEVMTSAHERCLKPDALEAEVVEALCEAKRQEMADKLASSG